MSGREQGRGAVRSASAARGWVHDWVDTSSRVGADGTLKLCTATFGLVLTDGGSTSSNRFGTLGGSHAKRPSQETVCGFGCFSDANLLGGEQTGESCRCNNERVGMCACDCRPMVTADKVIWRGLKHACTFTTRQNPQSSLPYETVFQSFLQACPNRKPLEPQPPKWQHQASKVSCQSNPPTRCRSCQIMRLRTRPCHAITSTLRDSAQLTVTGRAPSRLLGNKEEMGGMTSKGDHGVGG